MEHNHRCLTCEILHLCPRRRIVEQHKHAFLLCVVFVIHKVRIFARNKQTRLSVVRCHEPYTKKVSSGSTAKRYEPSSSTVMLRSCSGKELAANANLPNGCQDSSKDADTLHIIDNDQTGKITNTNKSILFVFSQTMFRLRRQLVLLTVSVFFAPQIVRCCSIPVNSTVCKTALLSSWCTQPMCDDCGNQSRLVSCSVSNDFGERHCEAACLPTQNDESNNKTVEINCHIATNETSPCSAEYCQSQCSSLSVGDDQRWYPIDCDSAIILNGSQYYYTTCSLFVAAPALSQSCTITNYKPTLPYRYNQSWCNLYCPRQRCDDWKLIAALFSNRSLSSNDTYMTRLVGALIECAPADAKNLSFRQDCEFDVPNYGCHVAENWCSNASCEQHCPALVKQVSHWLTPECYETECSGSSRKFAVFGCSTVDGAPIVTMEATSYAGVVIFLLSVGLVVFVTLWVVCKKYE